MLARLLLTGALTVSLAGVGALVGENPMGPGDAVEATAEGCAPASEAVPPPWAGWHARAFGADVTGDGLPDRSLVGDRRFVLWTGGGDGQEAAFSSPDEWLVSDGRVADLDGDGLPEVVLLVWRAANFGSSRPFWVEEPAEAEELTQHIFVLGWQEGGLRPRWMSSKTGTEIAAMDLDGDGRLVLTDRGGARTWWRWGSWGFVLEDEAAEPVGQATVLVAGDFIGHEALLAAARDGAGGFDFGPVFAPVADLVAEADLAVVGQEAPFVSDPALYGGYPSFGTPPVLGDALADAGFDVVLGASNHMLDRGERGVADTLAFWSERPEVALLGVREAAGATDGESEGQEADGSGGFSPTVVEVEGFRLALFNAAYGTNGRLLPEGSAYEVDSLGAEGLGAASLPAGGLELSASPQIDGLIAQIEAAKARSDVDLVVCFMHMGPEYGDEPSDAQREVAQRLADAGADAVLCAHGHESLGWELLSCPDGRACAVAWGLGNFAAVQDDLACMLGVCAQLVIERDADGRARVADVELVPTVVHAGRGGEVAVYPLADYDDGLAAEHYLNDRGQTVTVEGLWGLYAPRAAGE